MRAGPPPSPFFLSYSPTSTSSPPFLPPYHSSTFPLSKIPPLKAGSTICKLLMLQMSMGNHSPTRDPLSHLLAYSIKKCPYLSIKSSFDCIIFHRQLRCTSGAGSHHYFCKGSDPKPRMATAGGGRLSKCTVLFLFVRPIVIIVG